MRKATLQSTARKLAALLLVALWLVCPAQAQEAEWERLSQESASLLKQRRYEQSAIIERRALAIAEAAFGPHHPNVATSLNGLGKAALYQSRLSEAEPLFNRALAIREGGLDQDPLAVAETLNNLALAYLARSQRAEAEVLMKRALAIREKSLGGDHPDVAESLGNLAMLYAEQGQGGKAEQLYQRALLIRERALTAREKSLGADHLDVAESLIGLANTQVAKGTHLRQEGEGKAEPLYQRALAIREKVLGADHPDVANCLTDLADSYHDAQDQGLKAEPLYQRALEIREKAFGSSHPDVAESMVKLANTLAQRQPEKGDSLLQRALAIREQSFGPNNEQVADVLDLLAVGAFDLDNVVLRISLFQRALAIREKAFGPESMQVAYTLESLAIYTDFSGKLPQAEALFMRAVEIHEKAATQPSPSLAYLLRRVAGNLQMQGKYERAERVLTRAIAIWENNFSSDDGKATVLREWDWTYVDCLNALAELYRIQGRFLEAEPIYQRALALADRPGMGSVLSQVLNNLATLYDTEGQHAQAELIYKRALEIGGGNYVTKNNLAYLYVTAGRYSLAEPLLTEALAKGEKSYGPGSVQTAPMLNNLGNLYRYQQRYLLAEPLIKRSIEIRERVLGHDHPDVALALNNLGLLFHDQGRFSEAIPILMRATKLRETALGPDHPDVAETLGYLAKLYVASGDLSGALEAFRRSTRVLAVRIRTSAGNPALQRVTAESRGADIFAGQASLIGTLLSESGTSTGNSTDRQVLISEAFVAAQNAQVGDTGAAMGQMAARAAVRDDTLAKKVRDYQDAVAAWRQFDKQFIDAIGKSAEERNADTEKSLRQALADTDARVKRIDAELLTNFPDYQELVRPEPLTVASAKVLLKADEALVTYLANEKELLIWVIRPGLAQMLRVDTTKATLSKQIARLRRRVDISRGVLPYFSTAEAQALYEVVFAPVAQYLDGAKHVMVVADGPLQSLPFGLLVTSPVAKKSKAPVPWLIRQFAISNLPSVPSLRALRRFERGARAPEPFIGFGDPMLDGAKGKARNVSMAKVFARGALADIGEVRRLPRLPETADELKNIARSLGSTGGNVWLRDAATERRAKSVDLSQFRVVAFATHGLITGDFPGLAQPALVLTPPDRPSEVDDGLLTASEISGLKLNAEWVILSACNTAAADGSPGADGFSGLAKAFFYAGSKTLLVSHWAVDSKRTVALTSQLFAEARNGASPAEALRRAMLSLEKNPNTSHPAYWAPFVVVGEGGTTLH